MFYYLTQLTDKLSPGLKKILGNIGWLLVERLLSLILTFFVGILVIRYLGAENYGKLSYCLSLVALLGVLHKLGLNQIVIRNLVENEQATVKILGTAFLLKLIASLIVFFIFNLAILHFESLDHFRWILFWISFGIIFSTFDTIEFWFQSQVLGGKLALLRLLQLILISVAKILLIGLEMPLAAFAALIFVQSVLQAVSLVFIYVKYDQPLLKWRFDKELGTKLLKDSWPLIFSSAMVSIYMRIDQVMLGSLSSLQETGNYAAAIKFSEVFYFVPGVICSSVFPAILRAKQDNQKIYHNRLQQLYDMLAWLSLTIAVLMTLISVPLIQFFLGSQYVESGLILAWHIWALPFVCLGVARSQWLVAENYVLFSFLTTSLGAIANVGLNFWLIPAYGGQGAAIATVISYGIASHLSCLLYPPIHRTGWMLTKALFIPFRLHQTLIYINNIKARIK